MVGFDEPEMLLLSGLNAISTAYQKHIARIHQQSKHHQRVTFISIQFLDEKSHALSTHKKQLKLSLATFTPVNPESLNRSRNRRNHAHREAVHR